MRIETWYFSADSEIAVWVTQFCVIIPHMSSSVAPLGPRGVGLLGPVAEVPRPDFRAQVVQQEQVMGLSIVHGQRIGPFVNGLASGAGVQQSGQGHSAFWSTIW